MNALKYFGLIIPPVLLAHPKGRRDPLWSLALLIGGIAMFILPPAQVLPLLMGVLAVAVYCSICNVSQRDIIKQLRILPLGIAHSLFWYGFIADRSLVSLVGVGVGLLALIPLDGLLRSVTLDG